MEKGPQNDTDLLNLEWLVCIKVNTTIFDVMKLRKKCLIPGRHIIQINGNVI